MKSERKITLKHIRHSKGIYLKKQQTVDIAALMVGRGMYALDITKNTTASSLLKYPSRKTFSPEPIHT